MTSGRFASSQARSGPEKWRLAFTSGWRYSVATSGAYARSVTSWNTDGKFPAGWCWWKTSANRRRSATNDAFYQKRRRRTLCVQRGRVLVDELDCPAFIHHAAKAARSPRSLRRPRPRARDRRRERVLRAAGAAVALPGSVVSGRNAPAESDPDASFEPNTRSAADRPARPRVLARRCLRSRER